MTNRLVIDEASFVNLNEIRDDLPDPGPEMVFRSQAHQAMRSVAQGVGQCILNTGSHHSDAIQRCIDDVLRDAPSLEIRRCHLQPGATWTYPVDLTAEMTTPATGGALAGVDGVDPDVREGIRKQDSTNPRISKWKVYCTKWDGGHEDLIDHFSQRKKAAKWILHAMRYGRTHPRSMWQSCRLTREYVQR